MNATSPRSSARAQQPCPHCGKALPCPEGPVLCIACGWMPIEEIDRQLAYWSARRSQVLARLDAETRTNRDTDDVD